MIHVFLNCLDLIDKIPQEFSENEPRQFFLIVPLVRKGRWRFRNIDRNKNYFDIKIVSAKFELVHIVFKIKIKNTNMKSWAVLTPWKSVRVQRLDHSANLSVEILGFQIVHLRLTIVVEAAITWSRC